MNDALRRAEYMMERALTEGERTIIEALVAGNARLLGVTCLSATRYLTTMGVICKLPDNSWTLMF